MLESSFTFLRIRGIPIGAHWSWLLVFGLVAWSLSSALFPSIYPGLDQSTYLAMGVITAVLFFTSILLHELGHTFRAIKEGMKIDGITLWLFGGVARFRGMFPTAGAEFRIAVAGPIVSVVLAGFFYLATLGAEALALPEAVIGVTSWLARINAILVAFNMVPALPLDGGRVLRSWLWHRQRSFASATIAAARAGKAFGGLLAGIGLLGLFSGASFGGLWMMFLGWFLVQAAQAESGFVLIRQAFQGTRVRDLMTPDPEVVYPDMTIAEFLDRVAATRGHSTYPVVAGDQSVGLISLRLAGAVPVEERLLRTVSDVMLPEGEVPRLGPDTEVLEALDLLRAGVGRALVHENGRLAGILSISDLARAIEIEQARGPLAEPEARRVGFGVWVVVGSVMLLAAGTLYQPPALLVEPGDAIDIGQDITIHGVEAHGVNGQYLLTSVRLSRPNAVRLALAVFRADEDVVQMSAFFPAGADPQEVAREQRTMFRESQQIAAAAAARAAGLPVDIGGTGARVEALIPNSPAAAVLTEGDVIVGIDGQEIRLAPQVGEIIRSRPAETTFVIAVDRGGRRLDVEVTSTHLSELPDGGVGIGVVITTRDLSVQLPFEVEFRNREVGGPSAGLAYALVIADMLDETDYAGGRTIAVTGTIDVEGRVGQVGGVTAKAAGARRAGATVFLVPTPDVRAVGLSGLQVHGVGSLQDALEVLRATA